MPITGLSLWSAADRFRDHINQVLSRTITRTPVRVIGTRESPLVEIAFRQRDLPLLAKLKTCAGQMWLSFGQTCDAIEEGNQYRLRTVKYKYTLTSGPGNDELPTGEPILRWEYVREPETGATWCRHHLQGPVLVNFNRREYNLNDLHLPTGYVPFEEVIRFCLVDLEVPSLNPAWDAILHESYERFKESFVR